MSDAKQLSKLFASRLESYEKYTKQIKDLIHVGLEAIEHYILHDIMNPQAQVQWGTIKYLTDEEALVISALVTWPVGTKVNTADGSHMQLTKANAPYFNFNMHMGLPATVVFDTKEKIIEYLRSKEQEEHQEIRQQMKQLFGTPDSEIGFNMDSLTEEQQKALLSWEPDSEQNSRH